MKPFSKKVMSAAVLGVLVTCGSLPTFAFEVSNVSVEISSDAAASNSQQDSKAYQALVELFKEWRAFEKPPMKDGAPDYTAAYRKGAWVKFKALQVRVKKMDTKSWPVEQQVDWQIVQAEMNGYDFNQRILQPWVRDPAFYQSIYTEASDTPSREGPTNHTSTVA